MDIPANETEAKLGAMPKVTTLHFEGNRVEHLEHLEWISQRFPCLSSLVLCDCPLWTLRWKSSAARAMVYLQSIEEPNDLMKDFSLSLAVQSNVVRKFIRGLLQQQRRGFLVRCRLFWGR